MSALLLLLVGQTLGPAPAAAPVAPGAWVVPGFRAQVSVSEELEPDRLRALARPEVTLLVTTRSNALRLSTRESLGHAGAAYVAVRPPWRAPELAQFRGRIGPWVAEPGLDVAAFRRWSPGRVAVDVEGPLTASTVARVRALRPELVRWRAPEWPDAAGWAAARGLPGLELDGLDGKPVDCASVPAGARVRLHTSLTGAGASPCGLPARVDVPADVDVASVLALLVEHPGAELAVDVGADAARAARAATLLDALEGASPRAPGRRPRPDAGP